LRAAQGHRVQTARANSKFGPGGGGSYGAPVVASTDGDLQRPLGPVGGRRPLWKSRTQPVSHERYNRYVLALNELAKRGPEIRDWCRRLLDHPDYVPASAVRSGSGNSAAAATRRRRGGCGNGARGAYRTACQGGLQGASGGRCGHQGAGRVRPPSRHPFLRAVLVSDNEWLAGDSQWTAADAWGGWSASHSWRPSDPVGAARVWLQAHSG